MNPGSTGERQGVAATYSGGSNGTIHPFPSEREAPYVAPLANRTGAIRHSAEAPRRILSADAVPLGSRSVTLTRALHLPNSYWARVEGDFYTATLEPARRDDQGRALIVVKENGREFAAVRTLPQARTAILERLEIPA